MSDAHRSRTTRAPSSSGDLHIGEVAERAGLSLRTVRYYEEAGLLAAAGRTAGGFRFYGQGAVDRLLLIKKMKSLGFTLEEMRSLLVLRDELRGPGLVPRRRVELEETLRAWILLAEEKLAALRAQVSVAETFVSSLQYEADHGGRPYAG